MKKNCTFLENLKNGRYILLMINIPLLILELEDSWHRIRYENTCEEE